MVRGVRLSLCLTLVWALGCGNGNGNGGGDGGDGDGCGNLTNCAGACVNLNTDPRNCGSCGNSCPAGFACLGGNCDDTCPPGLTLCADDTPSCEDLSSSGGNCGACNNQCPSGTSCRGGVCVADGGNGGNGGGGGGGGLTCPPGLTLCVDDTPSCEDLSSSGGNCGACNNHCPSGTSCRGGVCVGDDDDDNDDD